MSKYFIILGCILAISQLGNFSHALDNVPASTRNYELSNSHEEPMVSSDEDDSNQKTGSMGFLILLKNSKENDTSMEEETEDDNEQINDGQKTKRCMALNHLRKTRLISIPKDARKNLSRFAEKSINENLQNLNDGKSYFRLASRKDTDNILKSLLKSRSSKCEDNPMVSKSEDQNPIILVRQDLKKSGNERPKKYVCYCIDDNCVTKNPNQPSRPNAMRTAIERNIVAKNSFSTNEENRRNLDLVSRQQQNLVAAQNLHCPPGAVLVEESDCSEYSNRKHQNHRRRPVKKCLPIITPCESEAESIGQPMRINFPFTGSRKFNSRVHKVDRQLPFVQKLQALINHHDAPVEVPCGEKFSPLNSGLGVENYYSNNRKDFDRYAQVPMDQNLVHPSPYVVYTQHSQYPQYSDSLVGDSQIPLKPVDQPYKVHQEQLERPFLDTEECIKKFGPSVCSVLENPIPSRNSPKITENYEEEHDESTIGSQWEKQMHTTTELPARKINKWNYDDDKIAETYLQQNEAGEAAKKNDEKKVSHSGRYSPTKPEEYGDTPGEYFSGRPISIKNQASYNLPRITNSDDKIVSSTDKEPSYLDDHENFLEPNSLTRHSDPNNMEYLKFTTNSGGSETEDYYDVTEEAREDEVRKTPSLGSVPKFSQLATTSISSPQYREFPIKPTGKDVNPSLSEDNSEEIARYVSTPHGSSSRYETSEDQHSENIFHQEHDRNVDEVSKYYTRPIERVGIARQHSIHGSPSYDDKRLESSTKSPNTVFMKMEEPLTDYETTISMEDLKGNGLQGSQMVTTVYPVIDNENHALSTSARTQSSNNRIDENSVPSANLYYSIQPEQTVNVAPTFATKMKPQSPVGMIESTPINNYSKSGFVSSSASRNDNQYPTSHVAMKNVVYDTTPLLGINKPGQRKFTLAYPAENNVEVKTLSSWPKEIEDTNIEDNQGEKPSTTHHPARSEMAGIDNYSSTQKSSHDQYMGSHQLTNYDRTSEKFYTPFFGANEPTTENVMSTKKHVVRPGNQYTTSYIQNLRPENIESANEHTLDNDLSKKITNHYSRLPSRNWDYGSRSGKKMTSFIDQEASSTDRGGHRQSVGSHRSFADGIVTTSRSDLGHRKFTVKSHPAENNVEVKMISSWPNEIKETNIEDNQEEKPSTTHYPARSEIADIDKYSSTQKTSYDQYIGSPQSTNYERTTEKFYTPFLGANEPTTENLISTKKPIHNDYLRTPVGSPGNQYTTSYIQNLRPENIENANEHTLDNDLSKKVTNHYSRLPSGNWDYGSESGKKMTSFIDEEASTTDRGAHRQSVGSHRSFADGIVTTSRSDQLNNPTSHVRTIHSPTAAEGFHQSTQQPSKMSSSEYNNVYSSQSGRPLFIMNHRKSTQPEDVELGLPTGDNNYSAEDAPNTYTTTESILGESTTAETETHKLEKNRSGKSRHRSKESDQLITTPSKYDNSKEIKRPLETTLRFENNSYMKENFNGYVASNSFDDKVEEVTGSDSYYEKMDPINYNDFISTSSDESTVTDKNETKYINSSTADEEVGLANLPKATTASSVNSSKHYMRSHNGVVEESTPKETTLNDKFIIENQSYKEDDNDFSPTIQTINGDVRYLYPGKNYEEKHSPTNYYETVGPESKDDITRIFKDEFENPSDSPYSSTPMSVTHYVRNPSTFSDIFKSGNVVHDKSTEGRSNDYSTDLYLQNTPETHLQNPVKDNDKSSAVFEQKKLALQRHSNNLPSMNTLQKISSAVSKKQEKLITVSNKLSAKTNEAQSMTPYDIVGDTPSKENLSAKIENDVSSTQSDYCTESLAKTEPSFNTDVEKNALRYASRLNNHEITQPSYSVTEFSKFNEFTPSSDLIRDSLMPMMTNDDEAEATTILSTEMTNQQNDISKKVSSLEQLIVQKGTMKVSAIPEINDGNTIKPIDTKNELPDPEYMVTNDYSSLEHSQEIEYSPYTCEPMSSSPAVGNPPSSRSFAVSKDLTVPALKQVPSSTSKNKESVEKPLGSDSTTSTGKTELLGLFSTAKSEDKVLKGTMKVSATRIATTPETNVENAIKSIGTKNELPNVEYMDTNDYSSLEHSRATEYSPYPYEQTSSSSIVGNTLNSRSFAVSKDRTLPALKQVPSSTSKNKESVEKPLGSDSTTSIGKTELLGLFPRAKSAGCSTSDEDRSYLTSAVQRVVQNLISPESNNPYKNAPNTPDTVLSSNQGSSSGLPVLKNVFSLPEVKDMVINTVKDFISEADGVPEDILLSRLKDQEIESVLNEVVNNSLPGKMTTLTTSTTMDKQYKNGHWKATPASLAPMEGNVLQKPADEMFSSIQNIIERPEIGLQGARLPEVQNIIVHVVENVLSKAKKVVNHSLIWETLNNVIALAENAENSKLESLSTLGPMPKIPDKKTPSGSLKNMPVIPVIERVFNNGQWSDKRTVLGTRKKSFDYKLSPSTTAMSNDDSELRTSSSNDETSMIDASNLKVTTDAADYAFLGESEEQDDQSSTPDVGEANDNDTIEKILESVDARATEQNIQHEADPENAPIKYYSPNDRILTYIKNHQTLEGKTGTILHLSDTNEGTNKVTNKGTNKGSNKGTNQCPSSDMHTNEFPTTGSLAEFEHSTMSDNDEVPIALGETSESEESGERVTSGHQSTTQTHRHKFTKIPKYHDSSQEATTLTRSLLGAAKIRGRTQQLQENMKGSSNFAIPDWDPTYFGKLTVNGGNPSEDGISDLTNTDLFYIGDGVKIPLTIRRMPDGSYALSISEKICERFINRKCPCCVPNEGDIVEESRKPNVDDGVHNENTSKSNSYDLGSFESTESSEHGSESKRRFVRSTSGSEIIRTKISPVKSFVKKYNMTLNLPKDNFPQQSSTINKKEIQETGNTRRNKRLGSFRDAKIVNLFDNDNRLQRDDSEEQMQISDDNSDVISKESNLIRRSEFSYDKDMNSFVDDLLHIRDVPENKRTEIVVNALDGLINSASVKNIIPMGHRSMTEFIAEDSTEDQSQWGDSSVYDLQDVENKISGYGYQKDNPIIERIRFIKDNQHGHGQYKYQQNIDHHARGKMNILKTVLHWLREVFLEMKGNDKK